MPHAELVEHIARTLRPMRGESWAELRGAADAVIRAEDGDSMAGAYALEGQRSRRVALLLEQARDTLQALRASLQATGALPVAREVKGEGALPVVRTLVDVQLALHVLGYLSARTSIGKPGRATSHALRQFQASEGLPATGIVTATTCRQLEWLLYTAGWDDQTFPARAFDVPWESTGAGAPPLTSCTMAPEELGITLTGAEGDSYAAALEAARRLDCLRPGNVLAFQQAYSAYATAHGLRPIAPTSVLDHPTQVALMRMSGGEERSGASAPGHAYGPPRGPFRHTAPDPYCCESVEPFPWHGCAAGEVALSPRQLGDPLYAAMRTPWMGAQGYGAQYVMHDQDRFDGVPTPAYRWHWLESSDLEGERS